MTYVWLRDKKRFNMCEDHMVTSEQIISLFILFLIGSNPLANSSEQASVDQIWKATAIFDKMTATAEGIH